MRNIALIHLESLNLINYRINASFFPNLYNLESRALFFSKYYSTATSTIMTLSDLAYGGVLHDESCEGIQWMVKKQVYASSFMDRCKEEDYRTLIIMYPTDDSDDTRWSNINHRIGVNTNIEEKGDYTGFLSRIDSFIGEGDGFVLWVCPYTSNISYNKVELDHDDYGGIERWKNSYIRLDEQVHDLMKILEKHHCMENTTVILYGDHGDDLYQHGWHGGLSHAVEPLETLIHTPLIVLDDRLKDKRTDRLVDTTMLADMVENLLHSTKTELFTDDFLTKEKKYAFSRNMYAAQLVKQGSFGKAYSITDGEYLLIAGNRGMQCYNTVMDPACGLNLLEMFVVSDSEICIDELHISKMRYHFHALFDIVSLKLLRERIGILREELKKYVEELYVSGECEERLYEIDFNTVNNGMYTGVSANNAKYGDIFRKYYSGKKVILYGAGDYGRFCYSSIRNDCSIVAWADRDYDQIKRIDNMDIISPDKITNLNFDIVFIAIIDLTIKQSVKEWLMARGISAKKIV